MTIEEINRILDNVKPTDEQIEYLKRADQGKELMAIFPSSKTFDTGFQTAIRLVRETINK